MTRFGGSLVRNVRFADLTMSCWPSTQGGRVHSNKLRSRRRRQDSRLKLGGWASASGFAGGAVWPACTAQRRGRPQARSLRVCSSLGGGLGRYSPGSWTQGTSFFSPILQRCSHKHFFSLCKKFHWAAELMFFSDYLKAHSSPSIHVCGGSVSS